MTECKDEHILNSIDYPEDLRKLSPDKLGEVCAELRQYIIDVLSENPGHLGASLGTVELTVALHYVFNTPYDRIVWDVGHQAYGHKILTGRREAFHTLRKFKGISGFPNPLESPYDAFVAGHASNSISAAMGMSVASALKGEKDRHVIAVIGDGAMTGGLAFEGLNNASANPNNLLIILNDNDMAIDHAVGGLSQYLVDITTSQAYNKMRYDVYRGLRKMKLINNDRRGNILRFNNSLKALLTQQHNLFEGFSIRYFGPIDGHDVGYMIKVLNDIKDMEGPKLLHIKTKKGKGFKPAEKSATEWHAPGLFNKETGERIIVHKLNEPQLYQDVFGHTLVELAEQDERIVGVTPAMPTGCSMTYMMKAFPKRAFDVGIAEGHSVTFSAGLAKRDDPILQCLLFFHATGIRYGDTRCCTSESSYGNLSGPCRSSRRRRGDHHGVFDLAYLRPVPNLVISSPLNELDLRNLMYTGYKECNGPFVIRYPRGKGEMADWRNEMHILPIGKGKKLRDGDDIAILSLGPIGNEVIKAIKEVESDGISIAHYDMIFFKPMDEELLHEVGKRFSRVITVENGVIKGGLGSAVLEFMADNGYAPQVKRIGVPDEFVEHGSIPELYKLCGMDAKSIAGEIKKMVIGG